MNFNIASSTVLVTKDHKFLIDPDLVEEKVMFNFLEYLDKC